MCFFFFVLLKRESSFFVMCVMCFFFFRLGDSREWENPRLGKKKILHTHM